MGITGQEEYGAMQSDFGDLPRMSDDQQFVGNDILVRNGFHAVCSGFCRWLAYNEAMASGSAKRGAARGGDGALLLSKKDQSPDP